MDTAALHPCIYVIAFLFALNNPSRYLYPQLLLSIPVL
jgi:hypothetical protein